MSGAPSFVSQHVPNPRDLINLILKHHNHITSVHIKSYQIIHPHPGHGHPPPPHPLGSPGVPWVILGPWRYSQQLVELCGPRALQLAPQLHQLEEHRLSRPWSLGIPKRIETRSGIQDGAEMVQSSSPNSVIFQIGSDF